MFKEMEGRADCRSKRYAPLRAKGRGSETVRITVALNMRLLTGDEPENEWCWIKIFFLEKGRAHPYLIGEFRCDFEVSDVKSAFGSAAVSIPTIVTSFRPESPGRIFAFSNYSIHSVDVSREKDYY